MCSRRKSGQPNLGVVACRSKLTDSHPRGWERGYIGGEISQRGVKAAVCGDLVQKQWVSGLIVVVIDRTRIRGRTGDTGDGVEAAEILVQHRWEEGT